MPELVELRGLSVCELDKLCAEVGFRPATTRLARERGTVVVEDLNVAGMLRNRRLARRIAGAGFARLRRQLAYSC